jgi:hypothetical protein
MKVPIHIKLLFILHLMTTAFFVYPQQAKTDMFSWFKKYDVHLSPAVYGQITLDGEPLHSIKKKNTVYPIWSTPTFLTAW